MRCYATGAVLRALAHARADGAQLGVDLAGRAAHDQGHNRVLGHADILVGTQDMDLCIGQHDTRTARVLNREARTAVFSSDAADRTA